MRVALTAEVCSLRKQMLNFPPLSDYCLPARVLGASVRD